MIKAGQQSSSTLTQYPKLAIAALLLLIVNDHIFKAYYPGFITGKLSDVAAAYLLPLWFEMVLNSLGISRQRSIVLATLMSVSALTAIEVSPPIIKAYEQVHTQIYGSLQLPYVSKLTADLTDLYAQVFSALYLYLARRVQGNAHLPHPSPRSRF